MQTGTCDSAIRSSVRQRRHIADELRVRRYGLDARLQGRGLTASYPEASEPARLPVTRGIVRVAVDGSVFLWQRWFLTLPAAL